ncbi:MAG: DUF4167 domain-containing protein [Sphingopyxis sp.]|nr:DUF4167 domain-containing protein [Sphingopyxis sp.]
MNNRQGGRRRGRNNQRPQSNGRGGDQGNRIDSRARGNAAQLLEKYKNMARDAQMSGDRVMTEYYLQFADHYFRVLSDARLRQEEQRARYDDRDDDGEPQDAQDNVGEAEDGDEIDSIDSFGRAPRTRRDTNGNGNGNGSGSYRERGSNDRPRDDRPRDDRPREERQGRDHDRPREERARDDRPRNDRPREDRQRDDRPRDDRPREERQPRAERTLRPRRERPADDGDEPKGLDLAVLPPAIGIDSGRDEAASVADTGEEAAAPKRRGRPRKVADENASA